LNIPANATTTGDPAYYAITAKNLFTLTTAKPSYLKLQGEVNDSITISGDKGFFTIGLDSSFANTNTVKGYYWTYSATSLSSHTATATITTLTGITQDLTVTTAASATVGGGGVGGVSLSTTFSADSVTTATIPSYFVGNYPSTSGSITVINSDSSLAKFIIPGANISITSGTVFSGEYGTLQCYMSDTVLSWTYTIGGTNTAVPADNSDTYTDTFTLQTADGTTKNIVITIESPTTPVTTFSADSQFIGTVSWQQVQKDEYANFSISGSITVVKPNTALTSLKTYSNGTTNIPATSYQTGFNYGIFTINPDSTIAGKYNWVYTAGQTKIKSSIIDTITLYCSDGTSKDLVITIWAVPAPTTFVSSSANLTLKCYTNQSKTNDYYVNTDDQPFTVSATYANGTSFGDPIQIIDAGGNIQNTLTIPNTWGYFTIWKSDNVTNQFYWKYTLTSLDFTDGATYSYTIKTNSGGSYKVSVTVNMVVPVTTISFDSGSSSASSISVNSDAVEYSAVNTQNNFSDSTEYNCYAETSTQMFTINNDDSNYIGILNDTNIPTETLKINTLKVEDNSSIGYFTIGKYLPSQIDNNPTQFYWKYTLTSLDFTNGDYSVDFKTIDGMTQNITVTLSKNVISTPTIFSTSSDSTTIDNVNKTATASINTSQIFTTGNILTIANNDTDKFINIGNNISGTYGYFSVVLSNDDKTITWSYSIDSSSAPTNNSEEHVDKYRVTTLTNYYIDILINIIYDGGETATFSGTFDPTLEYSVGADMNGSPTNPPWYYFMATGGFTISNGTLASNLFNVNIDTENGNVLYIRSDNNDNNYSWEYLLKTDNPSYSSDSIVLSAQDGTTQKLTINLVQNDVSITTIPFHSVTPTTFSDDINATIDSYIAGNYPTVTKTVYVYNDNPDKRFFIESAITNPTYGTFTFAIAGDNSSMSWTYTVNGSVPVDTGLVYTDTAVLTSIDGTPVTITVSINSPTTPVIAIPSKTLNMSLPYSSMRTDPVNFTSSFISQNGNTYLISSTEVGKFTYGSLLSTTSTLKLNITIDSITTASLSNCGYSYCADFDFDQNLPISDIISYTDDNVQQFTTDGNMTLNLNIIIPDMSPKIRTFALWITPYAGDQSKTNIQYTIEVSTLITYNSLVTSSQTLTSNMFVDPISDIYTIETFAYGSANLSNAGTIAGQYGNLTFDNSGAFSYVSLQDLPYSSTDISETFPYHVIFTNGKSSDSVLTLNLQSIMSTTFNGTTEGNITLFSGNQSPMGDIVVENKIDSNLVAFASDTANTLIGTYGALYNIWDRTTPQITSWQYIVNDFKFTPGNYIDAFTLRSVDGTSVVVTINITCPVTPTTFVISSPTTIKSQLSQSSNKVKYITGKITISNTNPTFSFFASTNPSSFVGNYGTLSPVTYSNMIASWKYTTIANTVPFTGSLVDTFVIYSIDNTPATLKITVTQ